MKFTKYILRCMTRLQINGGSVDINLHVLTLRARPVEQYELMCEAIFADIQGPESVALVMNWVRKVEAGEVDLADVDGNAWVMNITREKVWFEGLYGQGEGGDVSLSQFKLAVQAYGQFLSDPQKKPVEVEFPED